MVGPQTFHEIGFRLIIYTCHRQHDTDGNRQLDGLELFKGILHAFEHDEDMNRVDETRRNYIIAENHKAAMGRL